MIRQVDIMIWQVNIKIWQDDIKIWQVDIIICIYIVQTFTRLNMLYTYIYTISP